MNRTTVLNCISQHLTDVDGSGGAVRPLGELIPLIARELRQPELGSNETQVIPIPLIAAFIDGRITDEEEQLVCNALQRDNSVLAELVAALRAQREQSSLPPLSSAMQERLLALVPANRAAPSFDTNNSLTSSLERPITLANKPRVSVRTRKVRKLRQMIWTIAPLAVAAVTIIVVTLWWNRDTSNHSSTEIARETDPIKHSLPDEQQMATESAEPRTPERVDDSKLVEQSQGSEIAAQNSTDDMLKQQTEEPKDTNALTMTEDRSVPTIPLESSQDSQRHRIADIRWTKIQGVLARKNITKVDLESQSNPWLGTQSGLKQLTSSEEYVGGQWSTMAGSRAEASLGSGGKLVVAPDTQFSLQKGIGSQRDQADLEHGAIAFVDWPSESEIALRFDGQQLASFRWTSKGSVVLMSTAMGLQVIIDDGALDVTREGEKSATRFKDTVLMLGERIEELNIKGKQPPWVSKPIEEAQLPKAVLAQIGRSQDIEETIQLLLKQNALDESTKFGLNAWIASSKGLSLYEMISSRQFAARSVALERLLQLPDWSESRRQFWRDLVQAPETPANIRLLSQLVQSLVKGVGISAQQRDQLLTLMESPAPSTRGLSDVILRRAIGGGPIYDPHANANANSQSIVHWRRYLNANIR